VADADLAARLRLVLGRLVRRIRAEGGGAGLTLTQVSTLASVERLGPVRLTDLAEHEGIAPPTLTRLAASLHDAGYVARETDPADRRSSFVSITPAGSRLLARLRADRTAVLARRLAGLTEQETAQLRSALAVLEKLAG
jgi:DNA-binding MarR family transcriptional regulator